ncbi:hypothetical protein ACIRD6_35615 [Streptomyces sp. NPDC102473]|uniref:hypothetical protein n=1 Tax=Streptomyces sp. NPDC102473 TaxID=3366180 RepID=UPI003817FC5A
MGRKDATQAAVNAVATATTVINSYGQTSPEAQSALQAARDSVTNARAQGATDTDLRNTRPQ